MNVLVDNTKTSDGDIPVMLSTLSLPLHPGPLWPGVLARDSVLFMDQIELNCVIMLNWIAWNGTVFDIETVFTLNWFLWNKNVLTFNCVETKTILILNWVVWNRTVWPNWIEMFLTIKQCTNAKLNYLK